VVLLETAVNAKWDTADDVSSGVDCSRVLHHVPNPPVVAVLSSLESMVSLWAQLSDPAHPPDMLQQSEAISKHPDTGCQSSPQAGLEAAVEQPPESRLIDTVAALTCAHLAGRAASEEFHLRLPRHLPGGHLAGRSASEDL
jgi:hypothetical protein